MTILSNVLLYSPSLAGVELLCVVVSSVSADTAPEIKSDNKVRIIVFFIEIIPKIKYYSSKVSYNESRVNTNGYYVRNNTGGTYTDAVLFKKGQGVIQSAKSLTTKHDLSIGITDSCIQVLGDIGAKDIKLVSLSSTLATKAIVEKQGSPVCLILVGHSTSALEKGNLKDALDCDPCYFVDGGHKASGEKNAPLDEEKIIGIAKRYKNKVSAFAVCGIFSTRNKYHEHRIKNLLREHSDLPVILSSDLADSIDAPKRALTALLNARLLIQIHHLIHAVQSFLDAHKISAPLMIVKGIGSLMHAQVALDKPVETIMSGPDASVISASYLTGTKNAFISDIGGTTTDIVIIKDGELILSPNGATINGWNTMAEAIAL